MNGGKGYRVTLEYGGFVGEYKHLSSARREARRLTQSYHYQARIWPPRDKPAGGGKEYRGYRYYCGVPDGYVYPGDKW